MKCARSLLLVGLWVSWRVDASDYFVSTSGPLTLSSALSSSSSPAVPGDTVWIHGGTYYGHNVYSLSAPSNNPIMFRAYPGEQPVLDGTNAPGTVLDIEGSGGWFWGLDIMNSWTNRADATRPDGLLFNGNSHGANNKLINCTIHDNTDGLFAGLGSTNLELSGCILYNNGFLSSGAHGHSVYLQNNPNSGTMLVYGNIMLNSFGINLHLFGSAGYVCGINVISNIVYNSGNPVGSGDHDVIAESGVGMDNLVFSGNVFPAPLSQQTFFNGQPTFAPGGTITYTNNISMITGPVIAQWTNVMFNQNFVELSGSPDNGNVWMAWQAGFTMNLTADYNTYYAYADGRLIWNSGKTFAQWQGLGFDAHGTYTVGSPPQPLVSIIPNAYESGRANIAVCNWSSNSTVNIDFSSVLPVGSVYQLKNAANYYGPNVQAGVYTGRPISVPMSGLTTATPIGWTNVLETGPFFNAFVLLSTPPVRIGTLSAGTLRTAP